MVLRDPDTVADGTTHSTVYAPVAEDPVAIEAKLAVEIVESASEAPRVRNHSSWFSARRSASILFYGIFGFTFEIHV